jgi:toxin FitB
MVLLDTNILSEVLKPQPDAGVSAWFPKQTVLGISVISLDEVLFGLQRKRMTVVLGRFEHLLSLTEIVPVDEKVARYAAALRSDFSLQGVTRSQSDMLIAATALSRECTIATRNTKDFAGCGVQVVNPFSSPQA